MVSSTDVLLTLSRTPYMTKWQLSWYLAWSAPCMHELFIIFTNCLTLQCQLHKNILLEILRNNLTWKKKDQGIFQFFWIFTLPFYILKNKLTVCYINNPTSLAILNFCTNNIYDFIITNGLENSYSLCRCNSDLKDASLSMTRMWV